MPELQNFLLNYVVNSVQQGKHSDKYVRSQILQTLAVFYKRSKLDSMKSNVNGVASSPSQTSPATNMVKDVIALFESANIALVKFELV